MSQVAEIAGTATAVSAGKLAQVESRREMSVLKGTLDVQAEIQAELVRMIQQAVTGLGTNIDVTA
mgnify:CR=1 FL=1